MKSASVVHQAKEKQEALHSGTIMGLPMKYPEQGNCKLEYFDISKFKLKVLCSMRD